MFERKFVKIFLLILYWRKISPALQKYMRVKDINPIALDKTFWPFIQFVAFDILLFVMFFQFFMYIYVYFKNNEMNFLRKLKIINMESKTIMEKHTKNEKNLDVPDGGTKRKIVSKLKSRF